MVLKVESPRIPHKTEAKAIRLSVVGVEAVRQAFREVMAAARAYKPEARIEGVLVQEMVRGGIETILGVTNDPLFGPAVMFGLGGIFAEVMKDVSFRMAPVTPSVLIVNSQWAVRNAQRRARRNSRTPSSPTREG